MLFIRLITGVASNKKYVSFSKIKYFKVTLDINLKNKLSIT